MENFEVNTEIMRQGLEEALRHQLNLISEAIVIGLSPEISQIRKQDYDVLRRKAEAAGTNIKIADAAYDEITGETRYGITV